MPSPRRLHGRRMHWLVHSPSVGHPQRRACRAFTEAVYPNGLALASDGAADRTRSRQLASPAPGSTSTARVGRLLPSALHQLMQLRTASQPTLLTCCSLSPSDSSHTQTKTRPRPRRAPTEGEASGVSPGRRMSATEVAPNIRVATQRDLTGNQKAPPDYNRARHKPSTVVRQTSLF